MPLTDEQWAEKIKANYLEEFLDGAEPLEDSSYDVTPTPTHRLRLDMNGATPLSEVDLAESARRAAQWLHGADS